MKTDATYHYVRELCCKEKLWKPYEIGWENFKAFIVNKKIMSSIALIWYKLPSKELKDLKYVFDTMNDDMVELQAARKECGEIDVFLEQDCSAHSPNTIDFLPSSKGRIKEVQI